MTKKKRPVPREIIPANAMTTPRSVLLSIKLTRAESFLLRAAAQAEELPLSVWARSVIVKAARAT